jgi:hypothetical protein
MARKCRCWSRLPSAHRKEPPFVAMCVSCQRQTAKPYEHSGQPEMGLFRPPRGRQPGPNTNSPFSAREHAQLNQSLLALPLARASCAQLTNSHSGKGQGLRGSGYRGIAPTARSDTG